MAFTLNVTHPDQCFGLKTDSDKNNSSRSGGFYPINFSSSAQLYAAYSQGDSADMKGTNSESSRSSRFDISGDQPPFICPIPVPFSEAKPSVAFSEDSLRPIVPQLNLSRRCIADVPHSECYTDNRTILNVLRGSIYNPKGAWYEYYNKYVEPTALSRDELLGRFHREAISNGLKPRITSFIKRAQSLQNERALHTVCSRVGANFPYITIRISNLTVGKTGQIFPTKVVISSSYIGGKRAYDLRQLGKTPAETERKLTRVVEDYFISLKFPALPYVKSEGSGPCLEDMDDEKLLGHLKNFSSFLGDISSNALSEQTKEGKYLLDILLSLKDVKRRECIRILLEELRSRTIANPYLSGGIEQMFRFISKEYTRQTLPDIVEEFNRSRKDVTISIEGTDILTQYKGLPSTTSIESLLGDTSKETTQNLHRVADRHIRCSILPVAFKEFQASRGDITSRINRGNMFLTYKGSSCRIPLNRVTASTIEGTLQKIYRLVQVHVTRSDRIYRLARPTESYSGSLK